MMLRVLEDLHGSGRGLADTADATTLLLVVTGDGANG